MRLKSGVAVAVAGSNSSELTPSLETSLCCRGDPKKTKKKKKELLLYGVMGRKNEVREVEIRKVVTLLGAVDSG